MVKREPQFWFKHNLTQFVNAPKPFMYLGIQTTPNIVDKVSTNYDPLLNEIIELIDHWNEMPISVIGCINIIKMTDT